MCRNCHGLFWTRRGPGACPGGKTHEAAGSDWFSLRLGDGSPKPLPGWNPGFHPGWKWCCRCQGLFFAVGGGRGLCPAGGDHDGSQSNFHALRYDVVAPVTRWQWDNLPIEFGNEIGVEGTIERLVIRPNGAFTVWVEAHFVGTYAFDANVTVAPCVVDCWNRLYYLRLPPFHLAGLAGSGPKSVPFQAEGTLDEIQDNWRDFSPGGWAKPLGSVKLDYVNLVNFFIGGLGLVLGGVGLAAQLLAKPASQ
jgi:hypothetical protein